MKKPICRPTLWLAALGLTAAPLMLTACGGEAAPSAATAETPAAEAPAVEYEAAYPEEVSSEGLGAADVEQQETVHEHGEGTHAHSGDEADEHADDDPPH